MAATTNPLKMGKRAESQNPEIIFLRPERSSDFKVLLAESFDDCWDMYDQGKIKLYGFMKHYQMLVDYYAKEKNQPEGKTIGQILVEIIAATSRKYIEVAQWALEAGLHIRLQETISFDFDSADSLFGTWLKEGLTEAKEEFERQSENALLEKALGYPDGEENRIKVKRITFMAVSGEAKVPRWRHSTIQELVKVLELARESFDVRVMCSPTFAMSTFDYKDDGDSTVPHFYSEFFRFLAVFGPSYESVQYFNSLRRTEVHGVFNARELKLSTYHTPLDVETRSYDNKIFPAQPIIVSHPTGQWEEVLKIADKWFDSLKDDLVDHVSSKLKDIDKETLLSVAIDDLVNEAVAPICEFYKGQDIVIDDIETTAFKTNRNVTVGEMDYKSILSNFDLSDVVISTAQFNTLKGRPGRVYRNILVKRTDFIEIIKKYPDHETWKPENLDAIIAVYTENHVDDVKKL